MESELVRVCVVYQGAVRGEVNVTEWYGRRLPQPLSELVVEGIATWCAELTGKRREGRGHARL
jgi:hypothetical protein